MSVKLAMKFDLVLCSFDSLNYVTRKGDLQLCFKSVHRHLCHGGLFIFDLNSSFKINKALKNIFGEKAEFEIGNYDLNWKNSFRPDRWIVDLEMINRKNGKKFYEHHVERAYRLEEVRMLLKESGFSILGVYSGFGFEKVKRNSWKWFFVCRK